MKKLGRLFVILVALVSCVALFVAPAYAKTDTPIVVSMGDSFAAGEGMPPYYGQDSDNKYYNQDWLGHRSQTSWSSQLVIDGYQLSSIRAIPTSTPVVDGNTVTFPLDSWTGGTWFFVAASGAMTSDLYNRNSHNSYGVSRPTADLTGYVEFDARMASQIEVFDYIDATYGKGSVDYVTVSMGGMELDFSDVMTDAALNFSLFESDSLNSKLDELKEYFQNTLKPNIKTALLAIREAAGPQAKIIYCGYPQFFSGGGYSVLFQSSEMEQGDAFMAWLDQQLRQIVQELTASGFTNLYYVSVIDALSGHGAYSSDPWIHKVTLATTEERNYTEIDKIISPTSFHPNEKGAQAIAAEIQKLIDQLEAAEKNQHEAAGKKPGWAREDGGYVYYENDGSLRKNAWINYNGSWYYLGADGKVVTSSWVNYNGSWYYLGKNGKPTVNSWVNYNGSWYYLGKNGKPTVSSWVNYKGSWYYLGKNGKALGNSWVNYKGSYYYLKANGKPAVSETLTIGGKQYSFNDKGVCTWKSA